MWKVQGPGTRVVGEVSPNVGHVRGEGGRVPCGQPGKNVVGGGNGTCQGPEFGEWRVHVPARRPCSCSRADRASAMVSESANE